MGLSEVYLKDHLPFYWILCVQMPAQRSLYSVQNWRVIYWLRRPFSGAPDFVKSMIGFGIVSYLFTFTLMAVLSLLMDGVIYWELFFVGLAAATGSTAAALEGDSGRPAIVNLVSLLTGTMAGLLTLLSPWVIFAVWYAVDKLVLASSRRLRSVENFNEDFVFS